MAPSAPPADPALVAAQAQIDIEREVARAEIKREKTGADIAIAAFKARQWAEIERLKLAGRAAARRSSPGEGTDG